MSIPLTVNNPAQQVEVKRSNVENTATLSTPEESRLQLNASIVTASFDVAISSGNEPLALLFKSAINSINDILKPEVSIPRQSRGL